MTTREFLALPPDEVSRAELIYGEMITVPRPEADHNDLMHDLGEIVKRWIRSHALGRLCYDIDMILDEENDLIYAPDLLFLATANLERLKKGKVYGPADLAVEILSPSERPFLQNRKFTDYERYAIPWYWVIDPTRAAPTLREHHLVKGKYICRTEIVGAEWFEPGVFAGLVFRLPQLLEGDLKAAVKGKAKKLI
jgi:Uma2 family endonuclease